MDAPLPTQPGITLENPPQPLVNPEVEKPVVDRPYLKVVYILLGILITPLILLGLRMAWVYVKSNVIDPPPPISTVLKTVSEGGIYVVEDNSLLNVRSVKFTPELLSYPNFTWIQMSRRSYLGTTIIELPSGIGNITDLQTLIVAGNSLTTLPITIGNLKNLKTLILNDNQITSLPEEIGGLEKLEVLDLRNNKLTFLPTSLQNLTNLKRIDLGGNPIPTLEISSLQTRLPNTQINF